MMFIEKLKLERFKGFRDFTVDLQQVTCLVGLNSSGKTSILQAIELLHSMLVFVFGNKQTPDFGNPKWRANPQEVLRRRNLGDPDAIWLHKRTAEPCIISASFEGNVDLKLEISGRSSYGLDLLVDDESMVPLLEKPTVRDVVQSLFSTRPTYVPPVGLVSPSEQFRHHPAIDDLLRDGREYECWRSRLFWFWNDGQREAFDEVVATVQRYLPDACVQPPRLTHDSGPRVLVEFQEDDTDFDISTSGGGLRTLLNLAVVLRFGDSRCLLLDEPDSHLHGTLQRAVAQMLFDHAVEGSRQVVVATHAPEFISECPSESLVWVDRKQAKGEHCSDIGHVLVDLGAITKADAVRAYGADKILLVEGGLDRKVLARLVSRAEGTNPFDDPSVIVAELPNGKGDSVHLETFRSLLRNTLGVEAKLACVVDNDYEIPECGVETRAEADAALVKRLGVKEVENYLICPYVVSRALAQAAARRDQHTQKEVAVPSEDQVAAKLEEVLDDPEMKKTVKCHVVPAYRDRLLADLDSATREREADEWFEEHWSNKEWRSRNCPGKRVLGELRAWCQREYKLTLSSASLVDALEECPEDIAEIARQLQGHFYE